MKMYFLIRRIVFLTAVVSTILHNKRDGDGDGPVDTERKLNVHKTFNLRPGRLLNVLYTFNLRHVSTERMK